MMRMTLFFLTILFTGFVQASSPVLKLWYDKPASLWTEALPIGNGQMGAMIYGGIEHSQIQFNEYTIWTGKPRCYAHAGASQALPKIRQLLFEKKQKEAENLAMREFMSIPLRQERYQPCGDLLIDFQGLKNAKDYRRELNLETGLHTCSFEANGVRYLQESFAPYMVPHLLVHRIRANQAGAISCEIRLRTPHKNSSVRIMPDGTIVVKGFVQEDGIHFQVHGVILARGPQVKRRNTKDSVQIKGASSVEIRWSAATNFKAWNALDADPQEICESTLNRNGKRSFEKLLELHQKKFSELFSRVSLTLPENTNSTQPTDLRLETERQNPDPSFAALLFQYGRYLLISSSRPGGQPATLQGIWNESLHPAWDSKYTCNINTEMNYWPAEKTGLSECHDALFHALKELQESGRITARAHYDARGWVLHHNFDLWRGTAPINASNHGIWVSGSGWLSLHLWERYLYTKDLRFLYDTAWPIMREAAQFYSDFLIEDPKTHTLISSPSNSPEQGGLVAGPTMDHQIIRSLFKACIEAAEILGENSDLIEILKKQVVRIAPNKIGKHGQLQEWMEDVDNPRNKHRHVSHLWGVYPGCDITWQTPDTFRAARQSLLYRGDAATGWSMGWKVNLWARFLDGDHAMVILSNLMQPIAKKRGNGGLYPNLFDAHPPFQIDGNFGATSGIAEMLLQSHIRTKSGVPVIHILPALPQVWSKEGNFNGLRARGGFSVDAKWKENHLTVLVTASVEGPCVVKIGDQTFRIVLGKGQSRKIEVPDWGRSKFVF